MLSGEADTHVRSSFGYGAEKGREVDDFSILFKTIRIYILSEKRYLFVTLWGKVKYFIQNAYFSNVINIILIIV